MDAYSDECWATHKKCSYELSKIRKAVHPTVAQRAPEVLDFLRKWHFDAETSRTTNRIGTFALRLVLIPSLCLRGSVRT